MWVAAVLACNAKGAGNTTELRPTAPATPAAKAADAIPPVASASAAAPGPAAEASKGVTYAVIGVAADDVLNVREKPDAASKKVYSYGPTGKNIRATGQHQEKGATPWVEVAFDGGTGWVNRLFLNSVA